MIKHLKANYLIAYIFAVIGAHSTMAQVPSYGTSTRLDIGTWNMEWFGDVDYGPSNETLQFNNVKNVLNATNADVWGLTEVSNSQKFTQLLNELPQYGGVLATYAQTQKTALLYKKDMYEVINQRHVLSTPSFNYDFASRPPFEVTLVTKAPLPVDTLYFVVVHMKAFADQSAYDRRQNASNHLKDIYFENGFVNRKVIVLGDWNDDVDVSIFNGITTPYKNFLDEPENYFFPTKALSDLGKRSYASYSGSFIDHIMVTAPMKVDYIASSAIVMDNIATYISGFTNNTSDHYPVLTAFNFGVSTVGINDIALDQQNYQISSNGEKIFADGNWSGKITVYDLSGNLVGEFEKVDVARAEFSMEQLSSGMYLAHIHAPNAIITRKIMK